MWSVLIGFMALARGQSCFDPNCQSCESASGVEQCLECSSGLFPLGPSCVECASQPLECKVSAFGTWTCWCSASNSKSEFSELPSSSAHCQADESCQICLSGHYLSSEHFCEPCSKSCSSCVSESFCLECLDGLRSRGGICCDENCLACNPDECLSCPENFLLVNGKCEEQDKLCIESCLECVDFMFCTKCKSGFYLDGDLCLECTDLVEDCQPRLLQSGSSCRESAQNGNCLSCFPGYYLNGNTCSACHPSCATCDWPEVCRSCKSGFQLIDGYCCDPKCSSCKFEKCWACKKNYYFNNYQCEVCPSSCDSCNFGQCIKIQCVAGCSNCDVSGCLRCAPGFYLSKNVCHPCSSVCKTCDSLNYCTSCYSPSVLSTYSCCVDGCDYCVTGTCWRCKDGWLFQNYNCITCPSNCVRCDKGICSQWICSDNCLTCDGANSCTRCKPGYFLNAGLCTACNSACSLCEYAEVCTLCKSNFELILGYCCDPRCSSCRFEKCWGCKAGYLFTNNRCESCPANCGGCPFGQCISTACVNNCQTCDNGNCLRCKDGYYLSTNYCNQCAAPCLTCDTSFVCTSCTAPYVLLNYGCCSVGCTNCQNSVCWNCANGYSLVDGKCVVILTCPETCATCTSSTQCSTCKPGYYLDSGSCLKCNSRCTTCDWAEVCTGCQSGFNLVSGYCCSQSCTSCNFNKCWSCADGFIYDGTNCNSCPTTCSSCRNGLCVTNPTGSSCGENCLNCASPTWCDTCKDGYYPKSGGCSLCHPRCTKCDWYEVCTACATGFHLVSGYCCPTGCSSCNLSVCWSCNPGYNYQNGDCV